MKPRRERVLSLFAIFFTFFVDNLGWSLVFPVFAPFFVDLPGNIFSEDVSLATRTNYLGLFLFAFPFAQFFGAPLLGEFADRVGKKRALLLSVLFIAIGYGISAWSIHNGYLVLLFISRLVTGLFSGNLSICLAAITDLCEDEASRRRYFGYLSAAAGSSFILGAFIGGKLSDQALSSLFSFSFPFLVAAAVSLVNFLFVFLFFRIREQIDEKTKFHLWQGVKNIQQALKVKNIKSLYLIYFFFLFSWTLLLQFTPVVVVDRFHFSSSHLGDLAAFMGLCWALGATLIGKLLSRVFSPLQALEVSLIGFMGVCLALLFPLSLPLLLLVLGLGVVIASIAWPICTTLLSSYAEKGMHGKVLGVSQSMLSLAMALSPLLGGLGDLWFDRFPFFLAACATLLAALTYFTINKK